MDTEKSQKETESPKIPLVVAGDVAVESFFWKRNPELNKKEPNWNLFDAVFVSPQLGGAILLSRFISCKLTRLGLLNKVSIINQDKPKLDQRNPNKILHTAVQLNRFCSPQQFNLNEKVYRVQKNIGAIIHNYSDITNKDYPDPLDIYNDDEDAGLIVIHDAGNGFRGKSKRHLNELLERIQVDRLDEQLKKQQEKWPKALIFSKQSLKTIVYNMYPPLFEGGLWEHVIEHHKEKLILIINSDDLRKEGVNISSSLSWERTALDFLWEMKNNEKLKEIEDLNIIIRFGFEGVIHYIGSQSHSKPKTFLYFDTFSVEGGYWNHEKFGTIRGATLVFMSSIASKIASTLINSKISKKANNGDELEKAIIEALSKSREFLKKGHGSEPKPKFFDDIKKELFKNEEVDKRIACVLVPNIPSGASQPDKDFWTIFGKRTENTAQENVAKCIVKQGWSELNKFPVGQFGKLVTIDRAEIESFRSIMSIMEEYIGSEKVSRPLSIAVFGAPGSGKSFGITEVAKSIDPETIFKMDFNVSQFTSTTDLVNAFHRIRDVSLRRKVPLVFFDEFDCSFGGQKLGWLKYFLAPMQDGEFMDCGIMHPIGKSIFVFAGGISKNFQEFCKDMGIGSSNQSTVEKCPDFVSRLRGYVNILGPNPRIDDVRRVDPTDKAYIIRRAIILRSLIEEKAPNILDNSDDTVNIHNRKSNIDDNLLHALINIEEYKHGVRSMEAIMEMSMITGKKSWVKAYLPSMDQLELHVDGSKFSELLAQSPKK